MTEIVKRRKIRGGHRGSVKKLLGSTNEMINAFDADDEQRNNLTQRKIALKEKIETLRVLDNEILDLISEGESNDEQIEKEIEESEDIRAEIQKLNLKIDEMLKVKPNEATTSQDPQNISPTLPTTIQPQQHVRARLPRLEVRKFSGKIPEWQEFWDSFESSIHHNTNLADVDKFSYLRGLLIEPARSTIAGFALTSGNYNAAVELLKKRYGKKTTIQRAHVNDMLNIEAVYGNRDASRIRRFYDFIESKHRALEALGVDQATYSAFVVPSLLEKLPELLRLTITRGEEHHEWNLSNFLDALGKEADLREEYSAKTSAKDERREEHNKTNRQPWSTMHTGKQTSCAFCLSGHRHKECDKVKNIKERKKIVDGS